LPSDFYDAALNDNSVITESESPSIKAGKGVGEGSKKIEIKSPRLQNGDEGASSDLPDGFFDDPVEDAKVHHKPYVDPLDAQWDLFQKEIKMEAHKSEVIEDENEDVMIYERNLAEIDDQLQGWAKVEALHVKKEAKFIKIEIKEEEDENGSDGKETDMKTEAVTDQQTDVKIKIEPKDESHSDEGETDDDDDDYDDDDDDDDEDDADFDDLLDWRSKGT